MKNISSLLFIYFILVLVNSQNSNIFSNSTKILIRRNQNLMKSLDKIAIKRNLEDEDYTDSELDDEQSSDESESNAEESESDQNQNQNQTMPEPAVGNENAAIYLVDVNNFNKPPGNNKATFNIFFFFAKSKVVRYIFFTLKIIFSRFRNLQEVTEKLAICQIVNEDYANKEVDNVIRYNCSTDGTIDGNYTSIQSNNDFKLGNTKNVNEATPTSDISFSQEIEKELENIQTQDEQINNYYVLKDAYYTDLNGYRFTIKGTLDRNNTNDNNVNFTLYHNQDSNDERNVDCKVIKKEKEDYQIRCDSKKKISASLVSVNGVTENKNIITLNMKENYGTIETGNGTNVYNKMYKKSGSGLSGGGIAGIIIACVVALIIASIVAIMLKKPNPPAPNSSSIFQANSVDNLNG